MPVAHPALPSRGGDFLFELDFHRGGKANTWHIDVTFVQAYPFASILRAVTIPEAGGDDTVWSNTAAAYSALSEPLRALADSLWAVHSSEYDYAANQTIRKPEEAAIFKAVFVSTVYEAEHSVVRVHLETGERTLLVGRARRPWLLAHRTARSTGRGAAPCPRQGFSSKTRSRPYHPKACPDEGGREDRFVRRNPYVARTCKTEPGTGAGAVDHRDGRLGHFVQRSCHVRKPVLHLRVPELCRGRLRGGEHHTDVTRDRSIEMRPVNLQLRLGICESEPSVLKIKDRLSKGLAILHERKRLVEGPLRCRLCLDRNAQRFEEAAT